jgi:hypothetical protein
LPLVTKEKDPGFVLRGLMATLFFSLMAVVRRILGIISSWVSHNFGYQI